MAVLRGLDRRLLLIAVVGGLVALFLILRGEDPVSSKTETGDILLAKVMQAAGGKDAYNNIKRISFNKDFKLYREDGSIEVERKELHTYNFQPERSHSIRWTKNDTVFEIIEDSGSIYQFVNQKRDSSVTEVALYTKLYAATFVFGLPYTLDVSTSKNTDAGLLNFESKEATALKTTFAESPDVWTFYYAKDSLEWLGYWVQTADHYSLVINNEMTQVNGFTFPRKRKSYRTDSLQNKTFLRATYLYDNYSVK